MLVQSSGDRFVNIRNINVLKLVAIEDSSNFEIVVTFDAFSEVIWEGTHLECEKFIGWLRHNYKRGEFIVNTPTKENLECFEVVITPAERTIQEF